MEKTKSKGNFKENFKKHWKSILVLSVLVVLLAGVGVFTFLGSRNSQEVATTYTVQVQDANGAAVEEVYLVLCAEDGTELSWLPYATNVSGTVQFSDKIEEGCYVKVVDVPMGYKAEENVKYTFDEEGKLTIVLADDDSIYVAQIGERKYYSLATAFGVANGANGEVTVDLLADTTIKSFKFNSVYETKVIINGNGYTMTAEGDNNTFLINSTKGELVFKNINFIYKNTGSLVQMYNPYTVSLEDVNIDATQGTAYNYTLFNTLGVEGTTNLNMTRVNVKMAVGSAGLDNYSAVIRTGNPDKTKNVNINLDSCNFDATGATGRHGIVVMKNTVATLNIKNSDIKVADAYAVYAVEQTKAQTMTTVNSNYSSTKYPNSPIYGYAVAMGNTYHLPLQGALDIANASKKDVSMKFIGNYTVKTATINNKYGAKVILDGNGKTITTSGASNAFIVGGNVVFKNMNINHKETSAVVQMKQIANVTMTDVNINATEATQYEYCLINMLAAGDTSTLDCTRVNVTMAMDSPGKDSNAAVIRTGNSGKGNEKSVKINLTDCNFDTTKATGRSAIVVMKDTTATVNIKNSRLVTMDDFVIRSNEQDINWNNADTTLDSLSQTYHDYPVEWYLAKIGDVFYTLKEALQVANAATSDTIIEILADYTIKTYDVRNEHGKTITIDGNGKTITTSGGGNAFIVGKNVTLKDMTLAHKNKGSVVHITKAGTVNLSDVTINATAGSKYWYALINVLATDDVTTLNLDGVDATMSVAGQGEKDGKTGWAILRTGNDSASDAKVVNINMTGCNFDTSKATNRGGIVVMKTTTANINIADSKITTLNAAPISANENSKLTNTTITMKNTTLSADDATSTEFKDEPIRGFDAKIGDVVYRDLEHAMSKANSGDTIEILQDITVSNVELTKKITLDGNNKTIKTTSRNMFVIKAADVVEFKNMKLDFNSVWVAIRVEMAGADVRLTNVDITSTANVEYGLMNILATGDALTKLTLSDVSVDMDAKANKYADKAIIRTGNGNNNVYIEAKDCVLDASDAVGRSVICVMGSTDAVVKVENSVLKTNNISAIQSYNKENGQATVINNDFVCGKKVPDLTGYTTKLGDTWYVKLGDSFIQTLNNATEDMSITLTEDMALDLGKINNVNGKTITFITNGYDLTTTGVSATEVKVESDAQVTVGGQTLYGSIDSVISVANGATEDVQVEVNKDCTTNFSNIINDNGKTITIALNGNVISGKGNVANTVNIISEAKCVAGSSMSFGAFEDMVAISNDSSKAATIELLKDITIGTKENSTLGEPNSLVGQILISKPITIDGKGHTVTTYSKHTFKITSTGEVNMRNMTLDCYQQQSVIQVNSQVTVNLSDIQINAKGTSTGTEYYRYGLIVIPESSSVSEVTLNFTRVDVVMDTPAQSGSWSGVVRTGNDSNTIFRTINMNLNDCNWDLTAAPKRKGFAICNGTTANITMTDSSISTDGTTADSHIIATGSKATTNLTKTNSTFSNETYEAQIGNTLCTFAEAINQANSTSGATIQVLKDISVGTLENSVLKEPNSLVGQILINKPVTIDGNGHTITTYAKHTFKINCAGEVNMHNMTLECKQQQSVIQVNAEATVNLTDIQINATTTGVGAEYYQYHLISLPESEDISELTLNFTRVNVVMGTPNNTTGWYGFIRTGNDSTIERTININLDSCNWNLTNASNRRAFSVCNGATVNLDVKDSTISVAGTQVIATGSKAKTNLTRTNSTFIVDGVKDAESPATLSLEEEKEETKQLVIEVPTRLYDALIDWIKKFAEANDWEIKLN